MLDSKFSNHQFIVTGAGGFLGSALIPYLIKWGAEVIGLELLKPRNIGNSCAQKLTLIYSRFEDCQNKLKKLIDPKKETIFIHLAGISHAGYCQKYPSEAFQTNIALTWQTIEFCKKNNIHRYVFPSTSLIYGDQTKTAVHEKTLPQPLNYYAASKLACENLLDGYDRSFGFPYLILRFSNIYGPVPHKDSVFGRIIDQINQNDSINLLDLTPIRDFIFLQDAIEAIKQLLLNIEKIKSYTVNIGSGQNVSVKKLAQIACKVANKRLTINQLNPTSYKKRSKIVLNIDLLKKITKWEPQFSLEKGLRKILEEK